MWSSRQGRDLYRTPATDSEEAALTDLDQARKEYEEASELKKWMAPFADARAAWPESGSHKRAGDEFSIFAVGPHPEDSERYQGQLKAVVVEGR